MNNHRLVSQIRASRPLLAAIVSVGLLVGAGCSDEDTATKGSAKPTTTSAGSSASATSSAGSATTTTSTVPSVFTPPGEPSPLELAVGQPEPEFPAGENGSVETVPDGTFDALVVQVDTATAMLLVDIVQLVRGAEGEQQARDDGRLLEGDDPIADYYVRNISPKMRQLSLASDAALTSEPPAAGEAAGLVGVTANGAPAVSAALITRLGSSPGIPYSIEVRDGQVVSLLIPNVVDPTAAPGDA